MLLGVGGGGLLEGGSEGEKKMEIKPITKKNINNIKTVHKKRERLVKMDLCFL